MASENGARTPTWPVWHPREWSPLLAFEMEVACSLHDVTIDHDDVTFIGDWLAACMRACVRACVRAAGVAWALVRTVSIHPSNHPSFLLRTISRRQAAGTHTPAMLAEVLRRLVHNPDGVCVGAVRLSTSCALSNECLLVLLASLHVATSTLHASRSPRSIEGPHSQLPGSSMSDVVLSLQPPPSLSSSSLFLADEID